MKRPVRGDLGVSETRENPIFSADSPDDQGEFGQNESGTVSESGTELTQLRSRVVLKTLSQLIAEIEAAVPALARSRDRRRTPLIRRMQSRSIARPRKRR